MHNSLRTRPRYRGGLFRGAILAVALLGITQFVSTSTAAMLTLQPLTAWQTESRGPAQPVLLADEITRRLRRMGISFSRTRLPHPYDPVGEVC